MTAYEGYPMWEATYLPYGQEWNGPSGTGPVSPNHYKFTGKERDPESGLDYFGARYYASAHGRFLSPDPIAASGAHIAQPQRWNGYGYALNDPINKTDWGGYFSIGDHMTLTEMAIRQGGRAIHGYFRERGLKTENAWVDMKYGATFTAHIAPWAQREHFLRMPFQSAKSGYNSSMNTFRDLADEAWNSIQSADNGDPATGPIGAALHLIQDSFAHTTRDKDGTITDVQCFLCPGGGHKDPPIKNPDGSLTPQARGAIDASNAFLALMERATFMSKMEFLHEVMMFEDKYLRAKLPPDNEEDPDKTRTKKDN